MTPLDSTDKELDKILEDQRITVSWAMGDPVAIARFEYKEKITQAIESYVNRKVAEARIEELDRVYKIIGGGFDGSEALKIWYYDRIKELQNKEPQSSEVGDV